MRNQYIPLWKFYREAIYTTLCVCSLPHRFNRQDESLNLWVCRQYWRYFVIRCFPASAWQVIHKYTLTIKTSTEQYVFLHSRTNKGSLPDSGTSSLADPGGALGARPPPDPRFWGPKIELFRPSFNFYVFFFSLALLGILFHSYLTIFHNLNSKFF